MFSRMFPSSRRCIEDEAGPKRQSEIIAHNRTGIAAQVDILQALSFTASHFDQLVNTVSHANGVIVT